MHNFMHNRMHNHAHRCTMHLHAAAGISSSGMHEEQPRDDSRAQKEQTPDAKSIAGGLLAV